MLRHRNITIEPDKKFLTTILRVEIFEQVGEAGFYFFPIVFVDAVTDAGTFHITFDQPNIFQLFQVLRNR